MKLIGLAVAIIIGYFVLKYTRIIKASTSTGNPNQPVSQMQLGLGPQGPNDGSNNYAGSGHTVLPTSELVIVRDYPIGTRGFQYGASIQENVY